MAVLVCRDNGLEVKNALLTVAAVRFVSKSASLGSKRVTRKISRTSFMSFLLFYACAFFYELSYISRE